MGQERNEIRIKQRGKCAQEKKWVIMDKILANGDSQMNPKL